MAASTVSTAVPVKRSLVGAAAPLLAISRVTSKRLLRESNRAAIACTAPVWEASSRISCTSRSKVRVRLAASPRPFLRSSAPVIAVSMSLFWMVRASRVIEISVRLRVSTPIT